MDNDISYSMYIDEGEKKPNKDYTMPSAWPNDQFREIIKSRHRSYG